MQEFVNEPLAQFVTEEERAAFRDALQRVKAQFGKFYPVVIDGEAMGDTGDVIVSVNPSNKEEVVGTVAAGNIAHPARAVSAAREAFPAWRARSVKERADILRKAAKIIRDRKFEFCAWILYENGKSWRESDIEVCECIDFLEYYAWQAERIMAPNVKSQLVGEENTYCFQPRGVCAVIAPWNFPFAILMGMASAALVAGNTVILKPAEQTSVVGAKVMEVFVEAGVPHGVVNFLPGNGEVVGSRLVANQGVDIVAFTGSKDVGLMINEQVARRDWGQTGIRRVICEMGGKNAIIIDEDADLDEAIVGVMKSAFNYSGQKCSACSRVITVGTVHDAFMARFKEAVENLYVAPSDDPGCVVSPVIDEDSRRRILNYIEYAKGNQTPIAVQKSVGDLADKGYFVPPTVFDDVEPWHKIANEEIFGPVVAVMRASNMIDAVRIATGVEFALTGAVYSRNPENIEYAKENFRVGNLYINRGCTGAFVYRQPFGGFKMSGVGFKAGGPEYLLQFLEARTITENTMRRGFAPEAKN